MSPVTYLGRGLATLGLAILAAVGIWLLYHVPLWMTPDANQATTFRGNLVQLLSVAVAAAVAVYGIKKYQLEKDKQHTDSFSTAITHLSDADTFLQAGGARELGRIMGYSADDRIRVLETYADFLRRYAGPDSRPDPDQPPPEGIAAVLAIIRRREHSPSDPPLDLRGVRIPHADLRTAKLSHWNLAGVDLTDADLTRADLTGANLTGAILIRADLTGANLTGADLTGATLVRTRLTRTTLDRATLTNASLREADLRGTDLRDTIGLTSGQLTNAHTDDQTRHPRSGH